MNLNEGGLLIEKLWQELETYAGITIDRFVVMPNHLHGIVWIGAQPEKESGSTKLPAPAKDPGRTRGSAPTLAAVVQRYKTLTTNRYAAGVRNSNWPPFPNRLWQTNYFEHIIRDDQSLQSVRYYIENNPARWMNDVENPHGDGTDDVEQFVATLRPNTPQHLPSDIDLLLDNHS